MKGIYVTLYSDNATMGSFNTLLYKPIIGSFDVALVEISFPINWKVNYGQVKIQKKGDTTDQYSIDVYNYDYTPIAEICDYINYRFSQIPDNVISKKPKIRYMPQDNSINLWIESNMRFKLDETFAKNFRFNYNNDQSSIFSHYNKPVIKTISHLYVYCNIINDQFDGSSNSKLLRIVPAHVGERATDIVHLIYSEPHYCSLNTNYLNSIEITIKDHLQNNLKLETGRFILKLHFRQK